MHDHIKVLDGWRALSILMVLAGHLFPLGPRGWGLNGAIAATGMAIFFTLSGFLITRMLLNDQDVRKFLIRRLFRILPLAYSAMLFLAVWRGSDLATLLRNLTFTSNIAPAAFFAGGDHLWSLCVEVHFYLAVALIVCVFGKRGLYALPLIGIAVTLYRIGQGETMSIRTLERVDEIIAGAIVALVVSNEKLTDWIKRLPPILPVALGLVLIASAHPASTVLNYARPYIAGATILLSMYSFPLPLVNLFASRPARYVAATSYAVYVLHGMASSSWLGSGETLTKYLKRPLLLLVVFGIAHLSTFTFEAKMIALGKRLSSRQKLVGS